MASRQIQIALLLASLTAWAQQDAATATAEATAKVVAAISVRPSGSRSLDFGDVIVATGAASEIALSPGGTRTVVSGDATFGNGGSAAEFEVSGEPDSAFSVVLPESAVLTASEGGSTSTVRVLRFTHDLGAAAAIAANGTRVFSVGATLQLAAAQPIGVYRGTYSVTVSYQ